MRILVCIKQVPDSNAVIKVKGDGSGLELGGVKMVMNPFDEFAIEQAVRLQETRKDVEEIVALAVGSAKVVESLRTALAIGADRAVHVEDASLDSPSEVFLAGVWAAAVRREAKPFDLVLTGKQAIDLDAGEAGPALAEYLDLPHVGAVTELNIAADAKSLTAKRRVEGAEEIVACQMPALITCEKGLCEARYPSLPNLMKAKKKPLETLKAADLQGLDPALNAAVTQVKLTPPAERPPCKKLDGEPPDMARELVRLLREEAKVV